MNIIKTAALSLAVGLAAGGASAATLLNGSFERPGVFSGPFQTNGTRSERMGAWKVDSGNVDLINTYWTSSDGDYSLDMNGNRAGKISQTVTDLIVGKVYTIFFDMSGNPAGDPVTKSMTAMMGAVSNVFTFDTTGVKRDRMNWTTMSFNFKATDTSSLLSFASNDGAGNKPYFGAALDNVRIEALAPVPLPASGLLLMGAFGGAAALRRRRRKA